MAFVRPQRSAVPPAPNAGNYWGQYDAAADLPNTPGSEFNLPDLQAGDIAWVEGDALLYFCTDNTPGAAAWSSLSSGGSPVVPDGTTFVLTNSLNTNNNEEVTRTFAGAGDGIVISMGPGGEAVTGDGISIAMGAGSTGNGITVTLAAGATGDGVNIQDAGSGPALLVNKTGGVGTALSLMASSATATANLQVPADGTPVFLHTDGLGAGTGADIEVLSDAAAVGATGGDMMFAASASGGGTPGGVTIGAFSGAVVTAPASEVSIQAENTAIAIGTITTTVTTIGDAGAGACAIITHAEVSGSPGDACVVLNAARTTGGGGAAATAVGAYSIGVNAEAFSSIAPATPDLQTTLEALDAAGTPTLDAVLTAAGFDNTVELVSGGEIALFDGPFGTGYNQTILTLSRSFAGTAPAMSITAGASVTGPGLVVNSSGTGTGAYGIQIQRNSAGGVGAAALHLRVATDNDAMRIDLTGGSSLGCTFRRDSLAYDLSYSVTGVAQATAAAAGPGLTLLGGTGGDSDGGSPGGGGGAINVSGGVGGASTTALGGGTGGSVTIAAGVGPVAAGTGDAGDGGFATLAGGNGGDSDGTGAAGNAGVLTVKGGTGGDASGSVVAGVGGMAALQGGIGGAGSAGAVAGAGADASISGGDAGADGGGGGADGGDVILVGGAATGAGANGKILNNSPITFNAGGIFTVATLPSVTPAGQMIFVSDETGGPVPAYSDGTDWRRFSDGAIVS